MPRPDALITIGEAKNKVDELIKSKIYNHVNRDGQVDVRLVSEVLASIQQNTEPSLKMWRDDFMKRVKGKLEHFVTYQEQGDFSDDEAVAPQLVGKV